MIECRPEQPLGSAWVGLYEPLAGVSLLPFEEVGNGVARRQSMLRRRVDAASR